MEVNQQKTIISEEPLSNEVLFRTNAILFIISRTWWDKWCRYTGYLNDIAGLDPGEIDNSSIDLSNPDPDNYVFLNKLTWQRLKNWYGGGPKVKVFIIDNIPDYNKISVYVSFHSKGTRKIEVSLKTSLENFKIYVSGKFKVDPKYWNFFIEYEIGNKKKLKNNFKNLGELGFCHNSRILAERNRKNILGVTPLNILEEYEEDDALQSAITYSMNSAFDVKMIGEDYGNNPSRVKTRREQRKVDTNYTEYEMIDMGECTGEKPLVDKAELAKVQKAVENAALSEKVKLKLHSLQSLQKNLTQILAHFSNIKFD